MRGINYNPIYLALILETYVRITMIGYESKQNALKAGLPSMQFFQGRS